MSASTAKLKNMPGVYMLRNTINGKVYIGQSKDIHKRLRQYRWVAKSTMDYGECKRPITLAIREYGEENFTFSILAAGEIYRDLDKRCQTEAEFIRMYHADDPAYGYNETSGGEPGCFMPRNQALVERLNRAKAVFLYDSVSSGTLLYPTGAKGVGEDYGYGKDVMSHTVQRGSLFDKRYYIIPADTKERHALLEKLRVKKTQNYDQSQKARSHSRNAFERYEKAVKFVDIIAKEFGF